MFSRRYAAEEGAYVVVPGRDTIRDVEIPVLDGATLLLLEQRGSARDGDVLLGLVGDEVDLETIETRRLVRAGQGRSLVEMAVAGYLRAYARGDQ